MNLKPFDVEIDRALKALQLYVRMAAFFGAKLHVLPGHRRDVWRGSKHLFHKGGARSRRAAASNWQAVPLRSVQWIAARHRLR